MEIDTALKVIRRKITDGHIKSLENDRKIMKLYEDISTIIIENYCDDIVLNPNERIYIEGNHFYMETRRDLCSYTEVKNICPVTYVKKLLEYLENKNSKDEKYINCIKNELKKIIDE